MTCSAAALAGAYGFSGLEVGSRVVQRPGEALIGGPWAVGERFPLPVLPQLVARWSLRRLCAVQSMLHSASTAVLPRRKNWRKFRADLICPKTGSTVCFLSL